jgi:sulfoxide reductase heme-binding subunit YedZ
LAPLVIIPSALFIPFYDIFSSMGNLALILVSANLFVKPLSVLFPFKILKIAMTYRREAGVLAFWVFVGHVLGLFMTKAFFLQDLLAGYPFFVMGSLAAIGMTMLGLTSNNMAQRFLKRNWKTVQKVAYPTFFLILIHASLAEGEFGKLILFGGGYLLLKGLAYYKLKRVRAQAQQRAQQTVKQQESANDQPTQ